MKHESPGAASSSPHSATAQQTADRGDAVFPSNDNAIETLRARLNQRAANARRVDIACKILLVVFLVLSTALLVTM